LANQGRSTSSSLTPREHQILGLIWEGLRNREISDQLGVSPKTVEVHRAKIMKKLQARNTAQMIKSGIEAGFIDLPPSF
jgi:DNA-binding NarL/FixJ family response regulator